MEVLVRSEWRIRVAVDADELGRDALPHLRLVLGLGQQDQPGMRVHVDEPGADDAAGGVDHPGALDPLQVAAQDPEALPLHPDGAVEARVARAVDDQAPANQEIEHRALLWRAAARILQESRPSRDHRGDSAVVSQFDLLQGQ
jgi:hypothetical protein